MDQTTCDVPPQLSQREKEQLNRQDAGRVTEFRAKKFQAESRKHWDLFYKRNATKFFKDRHWTTREFADLAGEVGHRRVLLEVGCGVGNFCFPLLQERPDLFIRACDFSRRAVQFVKDNPNYDESRISAFQCDITEQSAFKKDAFAPVDLISAVFVLSAIEPEKFPTVFRNLELGSSAGGKSALSRLCG